MSPMSGAPGGGGGGGRTLGPQPNTFGDASTADRAAAEALRDAHAGVNPGWLGLYNNNRAFLILLQWTGDGEVSQRRNIAGDDWEDVTDVIRGRDGSDADATAAGRSAATAEAAAAGSQTAAEAAQAAAEAARNNAGMPVRLVLAPTYSEADNRLVMAGLNSTPIPSMVFALLPADIGRKSDALTVQVGADIQDLSGIQGNAVSARRLTPGALVGMLWLGGAARLVEPLPPRPQDFDLVVAWHEETDSAGFDAQDVVAGIASGTPRFTIPGAPPNHPRDNGLLYIGGPADAREIERVLRVSEAGEFPFSRTPDTFRLPVNGVPYRWICASQGLAFGVWVGRTYRVEYGDYNP